MGLFKLNFSLLVIIVLQWLYKSRYNLETTTTREKVDQTEKPLISPNKTETFTEILNLNLKQHELDST